MTRPIWAAETFSSRVSRRISSPIPVGEGKRPVALSSSNRLACIGLERRLGPVGSRRKKIVPRIDYAAARSNAWRERSCTRGAARDFAGCAACIDFQAHQTNPLAHAKFFRSFGAFRDTRRRPATPQSFRPLPENDPLCDSLGL